MIVSESQAKTFGRVVLQKDHADLAYQAALAFGNSQFAPLEPKDEMEFLVENHDRGWDEVDRHIKRNPQTGLPYSLVNTPIDDLLASGPASVNFNAERHLYCGLLASMHVWGLFNGRYGLSDKIVVDMLKGEAKEKADAMLRNLLRGQDDMKSQLRGDPKFRPYVEPAKLFQNYKALQFFDTLSLYFNDQSGKERQETSFKKVPRDATQDCDISLKPLGEGVYCMNPYPFYKDGLQLHSKIYDVPVFGADVAYGKIFAESIPTTETITLVKP